MEKLVLVLSQYTGLGYRTYYRCFFYASKEKALTDFATALANKKKEKDLVDQSNRISYKEIDILQEIRMNQDEILQKIRMNQDEGPNPSVDDLKLGAELDQKIQALYDGLNKFDSVMQFDDILIEFGDCLDEDGVLFEPKILTLDEWFESRR